MDSMLWLAIAVVSAVTAVILARRKNRSTVIWPVVSFVFPFALLPLFALAPLPEKNTAQLDRRFLIIGSIVVAIGAGLLLLRYGSLDPCRIYLQEGGINDLARLLDPETRSEAVDFASTPGECLLRLLKHSL